MKYILFLFLVFVLASSCRKDVEFTNSPVSLTFSTDTINFDTIFSLKDSGKIGLPKSITLRLIVTNPNESAIKTSIQMEGNQYGLFKLNADGISGDGNLQKIENIEINGKDSIYIFVQTYINPDLTEKFLVADHILFNTNGNKQSVVALTYSINANYFVSETLTGNIPWNDVDKPYVIYEDILVDVGSTLTINPGVKIYSHNNSTIYVAGTIKILGTVDNPVVFQGNRLDDDYKEVPNQWNGIHILSTSVNNIISGAIIKNGFVGIRVDSLSMNLNPKLELSQTIIQDMGAVGLLCYSAHVKATNNLISNCGQYCFLGDLGGKYEFTFNTFAATGGTQARKNATFTLTNTPFRDKNNNIVAVFPLSYTLINNIIWGSNDDEINFVRDEQGITNTAIVKNNNIKSELFRDELLANSTNINSNQITLDPSFVDANKKNYKIKGGSVCSGQGNKSTGISFDITNKFRSNPSIGAYEPD
jgi:hypothetical protein